MKKGLGLALKTDSNWMIRKFYCSRRAASNLATFRYLASAKIPPSATALKLAKYSAPPHAPYSRTLAD